MGTIVDIDLTMTGRAATATVHVIGGPVTVGATVTAVSVAVETMTTSNEPAGVNRRAFPD